MKNTLLILLLPLVLLCSCGPKEKADLVIYQGQIYTANPQMPQAEAVAVAGGKIVFVGKKDRAKTYIGDDTKVIELEGKTMIPGFVESHGHLLGLGNFKRNLDLMKVNNYEELVEMVREAVTKAEPGEWILGRGWHQSKWIPQPEAMVKGYQIHDALSAVSPDNPVMLEHASGHAIFANAKAMEIAGINAKSDVGEGGEIIRDPQGKPTGIFTENAESLIGRHVPRSSPQSIRKDLETAIETCLKYGITSFQDAGSNQMAIDAYKEFLQTGKMNIRLWVMLSGSDSSLLESWYKKGPERGSFLNIGAIKLYSDGALGSRGAWLLNEYTDRPGHFGNPVTPIDKIASISKEGLSHGFQVCTHAIGDRANREVLNVYEAAFEAYPDKKDHRFRIEHAQHVHPADIPRFAELGVIPSMQAIHMSSDRPWAIDRLGLLRIQKSAYMWKAFLESGAKVINGTDAPVEPVDPIPGFYAFITRKTLKGTPEGGYEPEQKMSRAEALKAYTLDAAYGAFEEKMKGSIEVGKYADFTVLSQNIMNIPEDQILNTEVVMTIVDGKVKYKKTVGKLSQK
ncbi:MAG: amidohydrolase [Bacteroidia bacterium]|nr:amidohydrolase [Bacteroidia bacterium]